MPDRLKWRMNEETSAFLVALDISGFSNDVDPDELLNHRMNFFNAVERTRLFPEARDQETVKVHFLGDELRLAFLVTVSAADVKGFVDDIFAGLDRIKRRAPEPGRTRIKGVVLEGVVSWGNWHNCVFLNGDLPLQAQNWMSALAPDEVAINAAFKESLKTAGVPVDFAQRDFPGETGYMLRA